MFTKKNFSALTVLALLILTQAFSYGDDISHKAIRYYAHRSQWLKSNNPVVYQQELNENKLIGMNTANAAMTSEGGGASSEMTVIPPAVAKVSLYPLYDKEYFYRENVSQPIRDFRSYGVKTVTPEPEYYGVVKHTRPLRDFRDYWNYK